MSLLTWIASKAAAAALPAYIRWPLRLLGGIAQGARAVSGWAVRYPREAGLVVLALACAGLWIGWDRAEEWGRGQQVMANRWRATFLAQRGEMRRLVVKIIDRTREAARQDAAHAARVERVQAETIERIKDDYSKANAAALAALRERLRGTGGQSGGQRVRCDGGSGATDLPVLSALPAGSLQAGRAAVVDERDAALCTSNTLRLEAVIEAWEGAERAAADRPVTVGGP